MLEKKIEIFREILSHKRLNRLMYWFLCRLLKPYAIIFYNIHTFNYKNTWCYFLSVWLLSRVKSSLFGVDVSLKNTSIDYLNLLELNCVLVSDERLFFLWLVNILHFVTRKHSPKSKTMIRKKINLIDSTNKMKLK